eukprot:CAMPEP_0172496974 /NCGR_PEP_ID=MMETSP1066-20121228/94723_1 /TAXON_ID=671091 /ORGANISM="Coscinodiscus wailesii, Strain CCMP2513" /LENGTH=366 /DNA_ID=CAMNT_0013269541 /DNA_START=50 /DNA_END=1150 /DNA_ORIENTATION=+
MAQSASSVSASTFRAKAAEMRAWRPENPPSNRDRLELYALHKQAVSGDAPSQVDKSDATPADKAKLNAWRSKRGLSQAESMNLYVAECDRQQRVYGFKPTQQTTTASAASSSTVSPGGTPTNTPAAEGQTSNVLRTPRGLAAIPLLCAAAAESRTAYLTRLKSTSVSNGWWAKQEPLCADPGTIFAAPENMIIHLASGAERISLSIDPEVVPLPLTVVQSFFWPLHNILLSIWILLIFICTLIGSIIITTKTILMGTKRTGISLNSLFLEEINPSAKAANALCASHQALSVRLVGLTLMPLVTICDVASGTVRTTGILSGAILFVIAGITTWWYWICVLPWLAFASTCFVVFVCGGCFALIELAGV